MNSVRATWALLNHSDPPNSPLKKRVARPKHLLAFTASYQIWTTLMTLISLLLTASASSAHQFDQHVSLRVVSDRERRLPVRVKACKKLSELFTHQSAAALLNALADDQIGYWAAEGLWKNRSKLKEELEAFSQNLANDTALSYSKRRRIELMMEIVRADRKPFATLSGFVRSTNAETNYLATITMARIAEGDPRSHDVATQLEIAVGRPHVETRLYAALALARKFQLNGRFHRQVADLYLETRRDPIHRAQALAALTAAKVDDDRVMSCAAKDCLAPNVHSMIRQTAVRYIGAVGDLQDVDVVRRAQAIAASQGDAALLAVCIIATKHILNRQSLRARISRDRSEFQQVQARRQRELKDLENYIYQIKIENGKRAFSNPFVGPPETFEGLTSWSQWYESICDQYMDMASIYAENEQPQWAEQSDQMANSYKEWADIWRRRAQSLR